MTIRYPRVFIVALALCALYVAIMMVVLTAAGECAGWTNKAGVCVAASILEAEFKDYKDGQPPPIESADAQLRQLGWNYDDLSAKWHACQANLSNATLAERQNAVKSADDAMFKRLNDAAPAGKVWDQNAGRYVEKKESGK